MGGEAGVALLVDRFYDLMESLPQAKPIRELHPSDLTLSREKLKVFLVGWLGGPRRYSERFGPMRIPAVHAHLPIGPAERDQWLLCMDTALGEMPVTAEFKEYFRDRIRKPANRVVQACEEAYHGAQEAARRGDED